MFIGLTLADSKSLVCLREAVILLVVLTDRAEVTLLAQLRAHFDSVFLAVMSVVEKGLVVGGNCSGYRACLPYFLFVTNNFGHLNLVK